ncbi:hypothetical protein FS837_001399 [Tulasnella sp. UAMH 9824]|nr:hypothetical protein FS837_001399 [Tulasnella sp. UAMH 9824]
MDKGAESHAAFRAHIDDQVDTYGKVLLFNLVKDRGREKLVKNAYEDLVWSQKDKENKEDEKLADSMDVEGDNRGITDAVDYVHFDLHSETSGDKWHRVDEKTKELGWTLENYGALIHRTPPGLGLDRTNLMQTAIAKRAIDQQAHDFGLLTHPELSIEKEEEFMKMFREGVWSDHGNLIATAYTGTGALRTDFTRTGVGTKRGVVFDKVTSGWRYILNNHSDGNKQNAFDVMTGAWQLHGDPGESVVLFLYASLFTISATYMARNSINFVAWPRPHYQHMLVAIYYQGPGARTKKGSRARGGGVIQEMHKGEKTTLEEAIKARWGTARRWR